MRLQRIREDGRRIARKEMWLSAASATAVLFAYSPACAAGPASAVASAPSANTADAIQEVVVTARRRDELAQRTPVAVSVVTSEQLESAAIHNITDLTTLVPGVNFTFQSSVIATSLSIRGQSRGPSGDAQPSVVSYVNEVPTTPTASAIPTYDVESVQVLKGPQGTLFGRNTTAGAVLITTKRPTYQFGAAAEATYGSYDWREFKAVLNIPIVDQKVALRFAGQVMRRDGYTKVINIPGDTLNSQDLESLRISLRLEPTTWLSNVTVFDTNFYGDKSLVTGTTLFQYTPGGIVDTIPWLNNGFRSLSPLAACNGNPICDVPAAVNRQKAYGPYATWTPNGLYGTGRVQSLVNTTKVDLGWADLKNIFGRRTVQISNRGNTDGFDAPVIDTGSLVNQEQLSDELQLSGISFKDALTWVGGLFYIKSQPTGTNISWLQTFAAPGTPFTSPLYPGNAPRALTPFYGAYGAAVFYRSESEAAYGQINYKLDRLWSVLKGVSTDIGLRYTSDKSSVCDVPGVRYIDFPQPVESNCAASTHASTKANRLTYTLGLNWQATDDVLAYVVGRSGYRAGGINAPVLGGTLKPFQSFQPQTVHDVEIGVKTNWMLYGMPGLLNLAAYDAHYKNLQQNITMASALGTAAGPDGDFDPTNDPINASLTVNVGDAEIRGLEADLSIKPTPNLTLTAGGAWTDPEITRAGITLPRTTLVTLDKSSIAAAAFVSAPRHSYTAGATYTLPLPGTLGELVANANYFNMGEVHFLAITAPSWSRVDLSLEWRNIGSSNIDLSVFVNNATDEHPVVASGSASAGLGFTSVVYGPPRMAGVRLHYAFGGEAR